MGYELEKKFMLKTIKDGDLSKGYNDVCACTFHGEFNGVRKDCYSVYQACHAHLNHIYRSEFSDGSIEVMLDYILSDSRPNLREKQSEKESIAFLQYFMDHPIFSKSFLEHDAELAFNERIMVRDLNSLPSNVCMFSVIACRALWEGYQSMLPRRMVDLMETGICSDLAFILSHYLVKVASDQFALKEVIDSGHNVLSPRKISVGGVKNYLRHKVNHVAPGTLGMGIRYSSTDYNVSSIFEPVFVSYYGAKVNDPFIAFLEKVKKFDIKALRQIEDNLRE